MIASKRLKPHELLFPVLQSGLTLSQPIYRQTNLTHTVVLICEGKHFWKLVNSFLLKLFYQLFLDRQIGKQRKHIGGKEIRSRKIYIVDEGLSAFQDCCEDEGHKHSSGREELEEIWEQDQQSKAAFPRSSRMVPEDKS